MGRKSRAKQERRANDQPLQKRAQPAAFQGTLFGQLRSGPLPDAEELMRYRDVIPDMPEVLLESYVKQGEHRRSLEAMTVRHGIIQGYAGLLIGGAIGIVGAWGSTQAMIAGHQLGGAAGLFTALAALVSVFVVGKRQQDADLRSKKNS